MSKEMENDNDMKKSETLPKCGLIMPISGIPDSAYTEAHWKNVKDILERSVRKADLNLDWSAIQTLQQLYKLRS